MLTKLTAAFAVLLSVVALMAAGRVDAGSMRIVVRDERQPEQQ